MRRTDIKTYPCHIQNNEAIASFDDSFRESVRKILFFGCFAEFLHCKYQYFEILCEKGFGFFSKVAFALCSESQCAQNPSEKNQRISIFF